MEINEFEKGRAIRAGAGGVGGVLARVACQHGWCWWRAYVGGMLAWVTWVACLRGWHGWTAYVGVVC